ncbi:MAG TPA: hypothetical protein VFE50_26155 [Cyclobacteriaceae bacterium]|nr:hypothetical protein [Cyclobacteriaceae bacterium]
MLPVRLYKNQPHWIRPLDVDIETVFSKERNKAFRTGKCIRWILDDDNGVTIGRVAAFVSHRSGGMGFFECINDREAAFALFDQCKSWLQQQGMEYMDGPVNFGDRDRWWGLLVDGYESDPNYQCNYHLPYYRELFEAYGFQLYFYQYTFGRKRQGPLSERLLEKSRLIEKDPDYSFRHLKRSEIDKMPGMIRHVYNKAWAKRGEIPELTELQAKNIVSQMKPIMDEKLLWFGFYKDEPIAFFLSLPEVNQIFKHLNGQFNWWAKLKFLWYRFLKVDRKAVGLLFGIVPEHQGKGVDGAIILHFRKLMQDEYKRYDEFELNWIGDFNPQMIRVAEQVQTEIVKIHITYRYLFDRNKPFTRMPFISK